MPADLHADALATSYAAVRERRQPLRCAVCNAPVLPRGGNGGHESEPSTPVACHAAPCQVVMSRRASMTPQAFRVHLRQHVALAAAQQASLAAQAAAAAERAARQFEENQGHWAALEASADHIDAVAGTARPPLPVRVALPSGPRRGAELPAERRRAYRALLVGAIRDARRGRHPDAVPKLAANPAEADDAQASVGLRDRLCALCAGGCCVAGGNHAYLNSLTMQRVMAQQPGWTARTLLAAYLGRLAERTQANSCINHTAAGCVLPRELRSDTCNVFECGARRQLLSLAPAEAERAVLMVVVRHDSHWQQPQAGADNAVIGSAVATAERSAEVLPLPTGG